MRAQYAGKEAIARRSTLVHAHLCERRHQSDLGGDRPHELVALQEPACRHKASVASESAGEANRTLGCERA